MPDKTTQLPVITCEGCGQCCEGQGSPPGYIGFLSGTLTWDGWPDPEDRERFETMPREARRILKRYRASLMRREVSGDGACVWLNQQTRQCRFYEHRPQICRDLEMGGEDCRRIRKAAEL